MPAQFNISYKLKGPQYQHRNREVHTLCRKLFNAKLSQTFTKVHETVMSHVMQEKKAKKVHTALPWMRIPAAYPPSAPVGVRDVRGMHAQLSEALVATGHANLFPVQAVAWEVLAGTHL